MSITSGTNVDGIGAWVVDQTLHVEVTIEEGVTPDDVIMTFIDPTDTRHVKKLSSGEVTEVEADRVYQGRHFVDQVGDWKVRADVWVAGLANAAGSGMLRGLTIEPE